MQQLTRRNAPKALNIKSLHAVIDVVSDHNQKIYMAAKWYIANGFMIVPFLKKGYPKGLSQHHATLSEDLIEQWWHPSNGKHPGAAIAMAHGGEAGFCAIDLDLKDDVNGLETFTELVAAYGDWDGEVVDLDTLMCKTPSGGRHLIFQYHPEIISNSGVGGYSGVDTRGGVKTNPARNGGITFVEPSRSIKPGVSNDKVYRWDDSSCRIDGSAATVPVDGCAAILDVPQWLVEVLNGRKPTTSKIKLQDSYEQSAMGMYGEGRDRNIYMDLLRFAGNGYSEEQLWGLLPDILDRMIPPDEQMVKKKIRSVLQSDVFLKTRDENVRREKTDGLGLDLNDKQIPLKTTRNLEKILISELFAHGFGRIEYDDFQCNFVVNQEPLQSVSDYSVRIVRWISNNVRMEYGRDIVRATIESITYEQKHTNMARNYMENCPPSSLKDRDEDFWGSKRRGPGPAFERLCTEVLDVDNPNLHKNHTPKNGEIYRAFLWFWLQGIVARAYMPGCKMEIVFNLFGDQGIGKSTFFRDLCPDPAWFTDSLQDFISSGGVDIKDEISKMHAKLIAEMPELSPFKRGGKSAEEKMKQFVSTQVDSLRKAYRSDTADYPRTCVLCGTSNNLEIYRDPTGGRRYVSLDHGKVPIKLGDHDNGVMAYIRDTMWGEVRDSFRDGELYPKTPNLLHVYIPKKLRPWQVAINGKHQYQEIGLPEILEWMENKTRISWEEVIHYGSSLPGMANNNIGSIIMRMVRPALANMENWEFRKASRRERDGKTTRKNFWVNSDHTKELTLKTGQPAPIHWSTYTEEIEVVDFSEPEVEKEVAEGKRPMESGPEY